MERFLTWITWNQLNMELHVKIGLTRADVPLDLDFERIFDVFRALPSLWKMDDFQVHGGSTFRGPLEWNRNFCFLPLCFLSEKGPFAAQTLCF